MIGLDSSLGHSSTLDASSSDSTVESLLAASRIESGPRVLGKAEPGLEPRREDFIETEILELAPLPAGVDAQEIEREVSEEEKALLAKKPHVLGRDAILARPFDGQPTKTDRSWRPLCHASTNKRWFEYLEQVRAFRALYAFASAAFRAGKMSVVFPPWTFRPWTYVRQGLIAT